jgi:energy-coupling factor transport system permease protein
VSDFEYLRSVNLGQYLPTGSLIHRLDARARILGAILLVVGATFTTRFTGLLLALAFVLVLIRIARIPLGFALRGLLLPLPFLVFLAVVQLFFPPRDHGVVLYQLWVISITSGGAWAAATLLLRFLTLILALGMASDCISTTEMVHGIERLLAPLDRLGIHTTDFVMTLQVMLRFIPFLALAAERIAKAQASRGAGWGGAGGGLLARIRQTLPMIVPLFLNGLQRAEALALAMDARGYAGRSGHASMMEMHFRWIDAAAICAALAMTLAILLV